VRAFEDIVGSSGALGKVCGKKESPLVIHALSFGHSADRGILATGSTMLRTKGYIQGKMVSDGIEQLRVACPAGQSPVLRACGAGREKETNRGDYDR
jgi:hypothetical protein